MANPKREILDDEYIVKVYVRCDVYGVRILCRYHMGEFYVKPCAKCLEGAREES